MKRANRFIALFLVVSVFLSCVSVANAVTQVETVVAPAEKITSTLSEQYELVNGDEIPVLVWFPEIDMNAVEATALEEVGITAAELKDYETDLASFSETSNTITELDAATVQSYIEAKRAAAAEIYVEHNQQIADELLDGFEVLYISRYSPVVLANLSAESALNIAANPEIKMISYYGTEDETVDSVTSTSTSTISLNNINNITRVNQVHDSSSYGYTGDGVKIGVFEISLPEVSKFRHLNILGTVDPDGSTNGVAHANNVLEIISSIAPDADYYLGACSSSASNMEVIEDLIGYGVNIITASRSIGGSGAANYCKYGDIEKWLDHIAYQHDVHFVKSSGNAGGGSTSGVEAGPSSGSMAYNIISVGNINPKGTTSLSDDSINTTSSYYSGSILANKPDICAPATGIITTNGGTAAQTGTSFAAPQVAGVIALLCEQRSALKTQQSTVKAILTASVNFTSPHRYTPSNANYKKYGAGLLDCIGACFVTGNYRYVTSNFPSSYTSKSHTFTVTSSDSRIRVSLAFNRKSAGSGTDDSTITTGNNTNLNIQVKAPNGTVVASSSTTNNNVEIVDFVPTTTGTYTVVITRPDNFSETVYYGLAWR